jgi:predicted nucleotidyltransferase
LDIDFESEILHITEQIIDKYRPEKIILIGSAVRGEGGPDSDADFLVIKKETPYYGPERRRKPYRPELRSQTIENVPGL